MARYLLASVQTPTKKGYQLKKKQFQIRFVDMNPAMSQVYQRAPIENHTHFPSESCFGVSRFLLRMVPGMVLPVRPCELNNSKVSTPTAVKKGSWGDVCAELGMVLAMCWIAFKVSGVFFSYIAGVFLGTHFGWYMSAFQKQIDHVSWCP